MKPVQWFAYFPISNAAASRSGMSNCQQKESKARACRGDRSNSDRAHAFFILHYSHLFLEMNMHDAVLTFPKFYLIPMCFVTKNFIFLAPNSHS